MKRRIMSLLLVIMMVTGMTLPMTMTANAASYKLVGIELTGNRYSKESDESDAWYYPNLYSVIIVDEYGAKSTAYYSVSMLFTDEECSSILEKDPKAGENYYFKTDLFTRSTQVNAITDANSTISIAGFAEGKVIKATTNQGKITVLYSVKYGPLEGDINGDGRINVGDVSKLYAHVKRTSQLTDDLLAVADVSGDGRINVGDVSKLYTHVKQTVLLTRDN